MSLVDALADVVAASGLHRRLGPTGPLILMYHGLGGADGVAPAAFAAQLELLAARRRVVPLRDAVAALGRPEAHELAALTFDDGYRDFAELALPALAARGLHATLFVPAGRLGATNDWDAGRAPERALLGAAELRALDPAHVEVGAHGLTHRRLAALPESVLREETGGARRRLEDACGRGVTLFAYPYGQRDDFDVAAERAVELAGYTAACSTCFGRGSCAAERFRLRRVGIEPADDTRRVERKLDGAHDFVALKERAGAGLRRLRRG